MELLWNVFETGINLFESCVVIHFLCAFLHHDFKNTKGKIIYLIGVALDFIAMTLLNSITFYEGILGVIYISIYLIYSFIFLKGTILKKVFAAFLTNIVLICTSAVVTSIASSLFKNSFYSIYEGKNTIRVLTIVFVQVLLFFIYDIILKYSIVELKANEWKLILSILCISFISIACIHIVVVNVELEYYYAKLILGAESGIIILNIVCFNMTYALSRSNDEAEKLRIQRQQEEFRTHYAENIKEQYEEIRRIRHDMKQNLAVISMLHSEEKYDEAQRYANKISDNLSSFDMVIDVGNDFVNAILNSKLSIAKQRGIKVLCTAASNISGIDDIDLCNLLGNMLDNAVSAAEKCDNGFIEVSVNADEDKILTIISNTIKESVLEVNENLQSTKNGDMHGYGVKTIQSIAKKYDGVVKFYEEDNMFYCQVLMYKQKIASCEYASP